jgi:hypothetical protein
VQFSHCLRLVSGAPARLTRANLLQTLVSFEGALDARLEFRFGSPPVGRYRAPGVAGPQRLIQLNHNLLRWLLVRVNLCVLSFREYACPCTCLSRLFAGIPSENPKAMGVC